MSASATAYDSSGRPDGIYSVVVAVDERDLRNGPGDNGTVSVTDPFRPGTPLWVVQTRWPGLSGWPDHSHNRAYLGGLDTPSPTIPVCWCRLCLGALVC